MDTWFSWRFSCGFQDPDLNLVTRRVAAQRDMDVTHRPKMAWCRERLVGVALSFHTCPGTSAAIYDLSCIIQEGAFGPQITLIMNYLKAICRKYINIAMQLMQWENDIMRSKDVRSYMFMDYKQGPQGLPWESVRENDFHNHL